MVQRTARICTASENLSLKCLKCNVEACHNPKGVEHTRCWVSDRTTLVWQAYLYNSRPTESDTLVRQLNSCCSANAQMGAQLVCKRHKARQVRGAALQCDALPNSRCWQKCGGYAESPAHTEKRRADDALIPSGSSGQPRRALCSSKASRFHQQKLVQ